MVNIETRHTIDSNKLSGESYFTSILREAYANGLLNDFDVENIQLQCIEFLAYKAKRYNSGESSSLRVETAESIMESNLYTVGLFLKSLPNADCAVIELKKTMIPELYHQGRSLIKVKERTAKRLYQMAESNKIVTANHTYNATLDNKGIGIFFRLYDPDYAAHEVPGSIDYQLCNPVTDLTGIEFMEKYLENLLLENEFCSYFEAKDIHHLLCGYDEGYKDLLINIFEQVMTAAVGCILANRRVRKLYTTEKEIRQLYHELSQDDDRKIVFKTRRSAAKMLQELNISSVPLRRYIEISLPKITFNIVQAVKMNSLSKTFVFPSSPELKTAIQFLPGIKMNDEDYRKLIDELLICRYSSDKLALIKEKVKSFADIEDILFDAMLSDKETTAVFAILGNVEIAALMKRHPCQSDIQAVDLSESEQALRVCLKSYVDQLPIDRQEQIFKTVYCLIDDCD